MQELYLQDTWFQQDGGTCHTARETMDLLRGEFDEHFISRSEPVNWPPRSCDLDYFSWGYVKSNVYTEKPLQLTHWRTTLKRLLVRYRPKCWKEYAKMALRGWTIWGAVTVNICMI
ncbi:unnamed protein product [Ceratitis capitata]|uniref:(Mediterranean fruit fly) hypothetical protein n=1 Tax=Ceratitis capitata TaxID=7213 RepID=A0A811VGJ5_CERCA|nr:unnamed protein product [Ceratitis capitata]